LQGDLAGHILYILSRVIHAADLATGSFGNVEELGFIRYDLLLLRSVANTPPTPMMSVLLCGNMFTKRERRRMKKLVARFGKAVKGVLTGFDRIVFKGTILPLAHEDGAMSFLGVRGVLNRDYKKWMLAQTDALVTSVDRYAREQSARPITPLSTWRCDKEQLDRQWPRLLNSFLPMAFPSMTQTLGPHL